MIPGRPRFPIVLTLACAVAFAILAGLGVWQLERLDWKRDELARIARLRSEPPQPIARVLASATHGRNVDLARVAVDCAPAPPAPARLKMTVDEGQWIARALAPCRIAGAPWSGVMADLGFVASSRGQTEPGPMVAPAPGRLVGVLFRPGPMDGPAPPGFAPFVLSVESESPPAPGVVVAPYAIGDGQALQYVGAYAPTWFGLAGVLACVYAALLWRRWRPRP